MSEVAEETREGSSPGPAAEVPRPQARAAREKPAVSLPAPVTERARKAGASLSAALSHPSSLAHSQPPTFAQARTRHHEDAGHLRAPLLRWLRLAWGYFHWLAVKPPLNALEWVTETPSRFAAAAAVAVLFWLFI